MKKFKLVILFVLLFTLSFVSNATDPPNPGGGPGTAPPLGGGAPVGSGLFIFLGLGVAYGVCKIYNMQKEELEE